MYFFHSILWNCGKINEIIKNLKSNVVTKGHNRKLQLDLKYSVMNRDLKNKLESIWSVTDFSKRI